MLLNFQDALAALDQLAAATSSETHRLALHVAIDAVHFQHAIESTLERYALESTRRSGPALPLTRPLEKWSLDEDVQLRLEFESGMTLDVIAAQHVRTPLEVAERLHKPLGLLTEQAVEEIRVARIRQRAKFEYESAAGEEAFDPELEDAAHGAIDMGGEHPVVVEVAAVPVTQAPAPEPAPAPVAVIVIAEPATPVVSQPVPTPAPVVVVVPAAPVAVPEPVLAPAPVAAVVIAEPATPVVSQPMPTPAPVVVVVPAAPAPAPVAEPAVVTTPVVIEVPVLAPVAPEVSPVAPEVAPAAVSAATTPAATDAEKPVLTADEETTVAQIMTKFNSKNAPKTAVRDYVKSERFGLKVRPAVQAWLLAELMRLA